MSAMDTWLDAEADARRAGQALMLEWHGLLHRVGDLEAAIRRYRDARRADGESGGTQTIVARAALFGLLDEGAP